MADYKFKSVDHIGKALDSDQLEINLLSWMNWAFLGIGAFVNILRATQSPHGSIPLARLHLVSDPRYTANTIWQGSRTDWVWENSVDYVVGWQSFLTVPGDGIIWSSTYQPLAITGIWVNNVFVPKTSTGPYAHYINFPEGRVVFAAPILSTDIVEVEYSYRTVQVRSADQPWFQAVVYRSLRADDVQFQQAPGQGGAWDILAQNRVQLPSIVVEPVGRVRTFPYEIGNSRTIVQRRDIVFNILTENPWDRKKLHDIVIRQKDKRLATFDVNSIVYPLDTNGTPTNTSLPYPALVSSSPGRTVAFVEANSDDFGQLGEQFYWSTVRLTLEFDSA